MTDFKARESFRVEWESAPSEVRRFFLSVLDRNVDDLGGTWESVTSNRWVIRHPGSRWVLLIELDQRDLTYILVSIQDLTKG